MGNPGNKYQVNLHNQKIAKISFKTCMLFLGTEVYLVIERVIRDREPTDINIVLKLKEYQLTVLCGLVSVILYLRVCTYLPNANR
jgi:hypothetical protein